MADSNITYSSSIEIVDPGTLFTDGYELSNQSVIESVETVGSFIPQVNSMEFYVYDANKQIIYSDYNFQGFYVNDNSRPSSSFSVKTGQTSVTTDSVNLSPEDDIAMQGFTSGKLYAVYNFVNLELGSSLETPYYLAEISSDRTEIRLKSNKISTATMKSTFTSLNRRLNTPSFFDEIYISFGNNDYHIGVNMKYDDVLGESPKNPSKEDRIKSANGIGESSVLIKLYDPLPTKFDLLDELYVCTKTAESQAYLVNFVNDYSSTQVDNLISLRGPNSNLQINEFVNGSTTFKSKDQLLGTQSTGSKDQLLNRLAQKGVTLNIDYSTGSFEQYINFSSAKSQISNFVEKVSRIQAYEADIAIITNTTASNPGVPQISESLATLYTKIENEITAFSGFDYYQYYATSSDAYPKSGTVFPLNLEATQSIVAQNWITAAEATASIYDENNQNWLYYTIPEFIQENSSNANYLEFVNMIGQSFDELWMYTRAIAEKNNTTNAFDKGVPLQLADDVITSLGYTGYGNNYNNQDNFFGLIGSDNGNYLPPTGSELITQYIAVNGPGGITNYWADFYSYADYVSSIEDSGFPYPIDKVSKEIFKRLYHNMAYLVKKKGTISGLRQLINIWGIPSTILRINEFGGKNKDEADDYDLWYQRFSYAFKPVPINTHYASASVRIPWQPLYRNYNYASNQLASTTTIAATGTTLTGAGTSKTSAAYGIDTQFTVTGGGSGGTLTLTSDGSGEITTATLTQGNSGGYSTDTVITITAAQVNALNDSELGGSVAGGPATFSIAAGNLNTAQGDIVPDGIGFRFKTTGYPSSSYAGLFNTQSLFVKKSITADTDVADLGIVLYYTGSMSGSGAGNTGATYNGGSSSAYKDYGEMRFLLSGSAAGGGTAISEPIYLPFFDKGWWSVVLQRDQHPSASQNDLNTTYTLYAKNKIYDGADGNQLGFQGSASLTVNASSGGSASLNYAWNRYVATNDVAGGYLGGWGSTLGNGESGSIGVGPKTAADSNIAIGLQGKNFSGSFQEFRYYSHDISESVFNDFVMNPESIEGNNITGSESSFDIVNFRAPLGNELENLFTSSLTTAYTDQLTSVHPAITGSSPLTVTASFVNPANATLTSSYDINYNANTALRTYSETNRETYFLDQPSIGIRNRISNKIKYSTNLNFGTTLSNKVSIQQDPPMSQSYTDNINLLEVAFSPTDEVNDDIIQSLGYGAIQEVIADPRFRSASDDNYPQLDAIAKEYFKKYYNSNTFDYLRLIKYFDDSLFRAIKNYVPARTSVSTGVVIKQNMLERSRYREPQVDIVTTQSYAPFNQPLTAKNLELTGSINTNQLWDPVKQTTYYSASDVYTFSGGAGGSVNQYNNLQEGGALYVLEGDNLQLSQTKQNLLEALPLEEVVRDITYVNAGTIQSHGTATITFGNNVETQPNGASDDAHSIQISSINPTDGTLVTKKYCASSGTTGVIDGDFIQWDGTGTNGAKAEAFAAAVNSDGGQGSGASTPTLTAVRTAGTADVVLTQLYGGEDSNTTIVYGANVINTFGNPNSWTNFQGGTNSGATSQNGVSTDLTGLTVNLTFAGGTGLTNAAVSVGSTPRTSVGATVNFTSIINPRANPNSAEVATVSSVTVTNPNFTGGTKAFENVFLNVDKSVQTPIYIDYDFNGGSFTNPSDVTIEASSSVRGVIMTNTTTYTQQDPLGSILENSIIDIHPGEDLYLLISSEYASSPTITQYQLILGENIVITRGKIVANTTNSTTFKVNNLDPVDNFPSVDSIVTGPDIKGGVVTVLGAVTNPGTGYTPSVTQVLATTGAGGNNLTLTVTTNSSGNVTTAAISGAANPGTGYTSGDVVTIVGGNNDATVAITTANTKTVTVTAFDPTSNIVTVTPSQTLTAGSKVTFTAVAIPDSDTIPVSQQGNWNYNITPLGVDTTWNSTQEQFYDGEYSGSNITVDDYFREQYNPYKKVKANSTFILDNIVNDLTQTYVSASSPTNTEGVFEATLIAGGTGYSTGGPATTVAIGPSVGSGLTVGVVAGSGIVTSFNIIANGQDYKVGDEVFISGGGLNAKLRIDQVIPITNITANSFDFDNAAYSTQIRLSNIFSASIVPYQKYLITYDITTTGGTAGKFSGFSDFNTFSRTTDINGVSTTQVLSRRNGIGFFESSGKLNSDLLPGQTRAGTGGTETTAISHSFTGINYNSTTNNQDTYYMGAMFKAEDSTIGTVSNLKMIGIGGLYDDPKASIFLTQQDQGYNNQKDFQVMSTQEVAYDALGNIITGVQGNTVSPIFLIENTESVLFNNSDYNPLSNNVNINRSSSYRYVLSYGATQSVPNNFDLVVTQSYFPTSISGTFPERADIPDSNYTMPSSVNSRYGGTKLKSLNYNHFTPSGSVGPEISAPIMPLNRSRNPVGFRVANKFLDGSVTSSFIQTNLGAGSASWSGDDPVQSGSAVIDKHPIYMARFENSYEQLAMYNSYQFNIDQLIEIPRVDIKGQEVTPNSITIDGSNENKKFVSSVFEPNRKAQISYLNPKTQTLDYTTMQVGNYDIEGGAVEFLTINSNAKSRVSASLAYQYLRGNSPATSSMTQNQNEIQMITGSNTILDPTSEGRLTGTLATTGTVPTTTVTGLQGTAGVVTLVNLPLDAVGGQGQGGRYTLVYTNTLTIVGGGTNYNNSSNVNILGGSGTGMTATIGVNAGVINSAVINNPGTGYLPGDNLGVFGGDSNANLQLAQAFTSATITSAGQGYKESDVVQTTKTVLDQTLSNSGYPAGASFSGDLQFLIASGNIVANTFTQTSSGFILSGSVTTNTNAFGSDRSTTLITGTELFSSIAGSGTFTAGVVRDVPTYNISSTGNVTSKGTGLTVDLTSNGTTLTSIKVNQGGVGYLPGDKVYVLAENFNSKGLVVGTNRAPAFVGTGDATTVTFTTSMLEGSSSPFQLNFNPSAISSSLITSSLGIGATSTLEQQLLIGGPQLAVYHAFNATVSSSNFQQNITQTDQDTGPRTLLWTTSGSNPANSENYYNWNPNGSDCTAYQEPNTAFLIERGDVIRVEGTLNILQNNAFSQSVNFIEDFTVEEIQDYFYSSSYDSNLPNPVNTLSFTGQYDTEPYGNTLLKGNLGDINGALPIVNPRTEIFKYNFDTATATPDPGLEPIFTPPGANPSGEVQVSITSELQDVGVAQWVFTGGSNIPAGMTFGINATAITNEFGSTTDIVPLNFQIPQGGITSPSQINNFKISTDVAATAANTPESGSIVGFHNYEEGEVAFKAPTFIKVFPDPATTLSGLPNGEITKFTIRRQIEADDKVMIKNIPPPFGSVGVDTPSGQGFLIPNDFSPIQKSNALNIINQLKAKNAFDKPNEPGITGINLGGNSGGGNPSGGGSGGGGLGGIQ